METKYLLLVLIGVVLITFSFNTILFFSSFQQDKEFKEVITICHPAIYSIKNGEKIEIQPIKCNLINEND